MFKIVQNRTFTHDVTVMIPIDGGHREETLKTTFNFLSTAQTDVFDLTTVEGTEGYLAAIVARFDDCVDESGQHIIYGQQLRDTLMAMPNVRQALYDHYIAAVKKTKVGN